MTSRTSARAKAFTLTEMLIVIGIILVLLSILLPATMRVMRSADRARSMADLQTIALGLDEYAKDFEGAYPRFPQTVPPFPGSHLLVLTMLAPGDNDGAAGFGFRARGTQGRIYGPYIKSEQFKYQYGAGADTTYGTADDVVELYDRTGAAIRYVPSHTGKPDIRSGSNYINLSSNAMFDSRYLTGSSASSVEIKYFRYMMGDRDDDTPTPTSPNPNGRIDSGETPIANGAYILWAAGPDGGFGPSSFTPNEAARCDDVIFTK